MIVIFSFEVMIMKAVGSQSDELRRYWQTHVLAWRKSGLSRQAYTRQHGLYKNSLRYWGGKFPVETADASSGTERRRISALQLAGDTCHSPSAEVKFVPVARVHQVKREVTPPGKFILRVGRRFRIDVPEHFSPASLASLLRTLERLA
ncbi:hypothetical protein KBA41_12395 [Candidatus Ozemobacteraceae bacterium]|nr:hypothetical protein [Candidatus Ozemobacteraceae bacterium]